MARTNRFTEIAAAAADKTNDALASEIADLSPITKAALEKMLPTKGDKERFAQLMAIVSSSTAANKKLAELKNNIDELGPVVLKTLKLLM